MMHDDQDESPAMDREEADETGNSGLTDGLHTIGQAIWELVGRSLGRFFLVLVLVFLASFLPAMLLILWLTIASQTYTRGGLFILVLLCTIPLSAWMGFNYVAYRGLRDLVDKLGIGRMIGSEFVAFLKPSGDLRLSLSDLADRLKVFSTQARHEARSNSPGLRGLVLRSVNRMVLFSARFALNRIAKGCVVDGEVDLERFATAIAERADNLLIAYFKKLLWDLTRLILSVAVFLLWLLIVLITQLVQWLA